MAEAKAVQRVEGFQMKYKVKFYSGDYINRQRAANRDRAICYVEQHFNASASPTSNYAMVVVGSNASETSKRWGAYLAKAYGTAFNIPHFGSEGIAIGGIDGKGNSNLKYTKMPAVLLEPVFCSSYCGSGILRSPQGRKQLASVLVKSIKKVFPDGGLVAFSIGHKGKASNPFDMGALVLGGGTEAEYAEIVLKTAAEMLEKEEV